MSPGELAVLVAVVQAIWTAILVLGAGWRIVSRVAIVEWKVERLWQTYERELERARGNDAA